MFCFREVNGLNAVILAVECLVRAVPSGNVMCFNLISNHKSLNPEDSAAMQFVTVALKLSPTFDAASDALL